VAPAFRPCGTGVDVDFARPVAQGPPKSPIVDRFAASAGVSDLSLLFVVSTEHRSNPNPFGNHPARVSPGVRIPLVLTLCVRSQSFIVIVAQVVLFTLS